MVKKLLTLVLLTVILFTTSRVHTYFQLEKNSISEEDNLAYGRPIPAEVTASHEGLLTKADKIVDNSGMLGSDGKLHPHNNMSVHMWQTDPVEDTESELWIQFDFKKVYSLGEMHIWNYNDPKALSRGLKDVKIFHSVDGENFTELKEKGYPYRFAKASGSERQQATNLYDDNHSPVYFFGIPARYVKITASTEPGKGNWGGKDGKEAVFGLSEVKFYDYAERVVYDGIIKADALMPDGHQSDSSINLVNGYGMSGVSNRRDTHGNNPESMWLVERTQEHNGTIIFDLNGTYPIKEMYVWNYNEQGKTQYGMKNVSIYYSLDNKNWTELKTEGYPFVLAQADGGSNLKATNLDDGKNSSIKFENARARYIKITPKAEAGDGNWDEGASKIMYGLSEVRIYCGEGILVEPAYDWTALFSSYEGYTGSDGIFSIPLSGYDGPGRLGRDGKTLFTFGDTFVGSVNPVTRKRAEHRMVNFTSGILTGDKPDPNKIVWQYEGARSALEFEGESSADMESPKIYYPDVPSLKDTAVYAGNSSGMSGYSQKTETHDNDPDGKTMWTSLENPGEDAWIQFDLGADYPLSEMWIWNYNRHNPAEPHIPYANRGLRDVVISYSSDGTNWTELKGKGYPYRFAKADGSEALKATNLDDGKNSPVDLSGVTARYIRITANPKPGAGNWGGVDGSEAVFGLSEARFYKENGEPLYYTVASSGSTQPVEMESNWHWICDGVVVNGYWYAFTIHLVSDPAGPPGFQFKAVGTNMVKAPVTEDGVDYSKSVQFDTPLDRPYKSGPKHEGITFVRGIMANTEEAGAPDPDGYIYLYGNENILFGSLTVARVKPEDIENFNEYRFWTGTEWSADITKAKGILPGTSPELSVSPVTSGVYKGKYIIVFQMVGISEETCYAVGDTPYGPFSKSEKLYVVEKDPIAYHYNAKAHPHLSKEGELLISYNKNTTESMSTHIEDADLYRPRFLVMRETSPGNGEQYKSAPDTGKGSGKGNKSESISEADDNLRNDKDRSPSTGDVGIFLASLLLMTAGIVLINKLVK